jgi:hypothetical protein
MVHNKSIKRPRKGSRRKEQRKPKCSLVWSTGQCPVHQGRSTLNSSPSGFPGAPPLKVTGLSGAPAEQRLPTRNGRLCKVNSGFQMSEQQVRGAPDCPVRHWTVRCHMRTKPPTVDQLQPWRTGWRGGSPDTIRWRTGHCPMAHRTVWCAHRQQTSPTAIFCLVAINTTPTGHFKVWESKQHFKSSSWHTQALPTTYIHWSILYTRFIPLQPTQVPQKREQAIESYSIEFSPSALWDSLRDSVCYIFVFICACSFDSHWTSYKVLEACKS